MKLGPTAVLVTLLTLPTMARADFVLSGTLAPQFQAEAAAPAAPVPPEQLATHSNPTPAPIRETPRAPASMFRTASGFGNDVPLGFAIRQIVPPAIAVGFGPGANSDAAVSWRGGDPWNVVLAKAVHPLGLRLVITHMAVEIRK